ncbi:MAG: hypothetical protein BWK78_02675 [Thiotrichaceae bacterium IS1]|nr:MAG: hypothetical protein BWK78_02675 [Thiotrichaceae bacterium IS1]
MYHTTNNLPDLTGEIERLHSIWQSFRQQWEATQEIWSDSVSQTFEQNFIQSLTDQVNLTQRELTHLSEVTVQANRDILETR